MEKDNEIKKRLEVIIGLMLEERARKNMKLLLRDQFEQLNRFDLKPKEIGAILNRTSSYISKELSILKGGKK